MATKAQGNDCYEKAGQDEPVFTLRAQDITAHLFVALWSDSQRYVRNRIQAGATVDDALASLDEKISTVFAGDDLRGCTEKEKGANECANAMTDWPTRKLAD